MNGRTRSARRHSLTALPGAASVLIMFALMVSGIGYAWQDTGGGGYSSPNLTLVITSMTKTSGPSYVIFSLTSPLPSSTANAIVGPFAPGDTVEVTYIVKNTGSIPASLSSLGVSVTPSGNGFSASNGLIPPTLNPGSTFSSKITIVFNSPGNAYEGRTATITLKINGAGTVSSCTTTVTHTSTKTVTTTRTTTRTTTVTKTITKTGGYEAGATALWATSSTCTIFTISTTVTTTSTTTRTVIVTTTKSITRTVCSDYDNDCDR